VLLQFLKQYIMVDGVECFGIIDANASDIRLLEEARNMIYCGFKADVVDPV